jgi:hypothetical protein
MRLTLLCLVLLADDKPAWVELPFKASAPKSGTTPRELFNHPPRATWTTWELELDASPGATLKLAELATTLPVTELALIPGDGRSPVSVQVAPDWARLKLPAVGELSLGASNEPKWRAWKTPDLAVTLNRSTLRGSLFLRNGEWPPAAPSSGARFDDWKLLAGPALAPIIVWQRTGLALAGSELVLTDLETGKLSRRPVGGAVTDVGCATLRPLVCAVATASGLVVIDGAAKSALEGSANGGLEMSPDGDRIAAVSITAGQATVALYRRSKKSWVKHVIATSAPVEVGRFSDDPPGFVVTVEGEGSLLLGLDTTDRKSVARSGPSWTSPLGKKLERRGEVLWLHAPLAASVPLDWVKPGGGPNAWLDEQHVLSGGGSVMVLDLSEKSVLPLVDPRLKLGGVFPAGDDPSWVMVTRPDGAYRARLSLP